MTDIDKTETFMKKGEIHYVWPHPFNNGSSSKCGDCRYFVADEKNKSGWSHILSGECHSRAAKTERGYIHSRKEWDSTDSIGFCHWWFPIEKQESEKTLLDYLPEEE